MNVSGIPLTIPSQSLDCIDFCQAALDSADATFQLKAMGVLILGVIVLAIDSWTDIGQRLPGWHWVKVLLPYYFIFYLTYISLFGGLR